MQQVSPERNRAEKIAYWCPIYMGSRPPFREDPWTKFGDPCVLSGRKFAARSIRWELTENPCRLCPTGSRSNQPVSAAFSPTYSVGQLGKAYCCSLPSCRRERAAFSKSPEGQALRPEPGARLRANCSGMSCPAARLNAQKEHYVFSVCTGAGDTEF